MHYVLATVIIALLLIIWQWVQRLTRDGTAPQQPQHDACNACTRVKTCGADGYAYPDNFAHMDSDSETGGSRRRDAAATPAVIVSRVRHPVIGAGTESEVNHEQ